MGFILSKVIWPLAVPSNMLAIALVLGGVLTFTRWRRLGCRLLGFSAAAVLLVMLLPVDEWLILPLESHFPPPDPLPAEVDGIVVLGGGVNESPAPVLGGAQLGSASDRLTAMLILARRYPAARVVYAGGNATLAGGPREADITAALLAEMGSVPANVVFERDSRTTYENAVFSKALVEPQPGETWLLVTSAIHMPRAIAVFRGQGWSPVPLPVDYATDGELRALRPAQSLSSRLAAIDAAAHEWAGLAVYRLFGYSRSLWPDPAE